MILAARSEQTAVWAFDERDPGGRLERFREIVRYPLGHSPHPSPPDGPERRHQYRKNQSGGGRRLPRITPAPSPASVQEVDAPRLDRRALQVAVEVVGQILRRLIAPPWVLLQTFQTDRLQIAGELRIEHSRRDRLRVDDKQYGVERGRRLERRAARKQFVKDRADRIDVACRTEASAFAVGLFRGHIARRGKAKSRFGT